ncbi:MAG: hypothetical protein AAB368_04685, partial [bacterium]
MNNMGLALALLSLAAAVPARAGDAERDRIKKYVFEIRPIEFRVPAGLNPFIPLLPYKAAAPGASSGWKVRISSLQLSSVLVGRKKVAIFKESWGPRYPYILVDGVLEGPDHKPVPGIEGIIEAGARRGEYHVTLRQGAESIEFNQVDRDEEQRATARQDAKTAAE